MSKEAVTTGRPNQPAPPQEIFEKIAKQNGQTDFSKKLANVPTKPLPKVKQKS